ncbi:GNAT family N-acetyltransferase [Desulfobulbus alkaliphilus]|uniref:GNAT family N-acetyltransferase n=1 Tax=Desulfobulbus alkaliphilus TaxID=869814 RepID=UPI0019667C5B|nr:GNAT family N-acetyltransferase [Desulfobulbus alkaliphilus]MBM9535717.1 GNAT family N-acetyltransferase [Desulfobulbus alkaliphilus]
MLIEPPSCMATVIRDYQKKDYQACAALVGQTWQFSQHFSPQSFCDVAQYAYTHGSIMGSNFARVIESNKGVAGFLFGRNERRPLAAGAMQLVLFELIFLKRLFWVRSMSLRRKSAFIGILKRHEQNRSKVERRGASEINLLVIEQGLQRQEQGRHLLSLFIDDCMEHGVERVIVETNLTQASGFYEKCGFLKIGDFVSPLHEMAMGSGSMAALYECKLPIP